METGKDVLRDARAALRAHSPFLAFALDEVEVTANPSVPTARVRLGAGRFIIEYGPDYLAGLPPPQQAAVLEHELLHIFHRHAERRGDRDPGRWNLACDLAINALIPGLPPDAVLPPRAKRGKRAEEIYEGLREEVAARGCLLQLPPEGSSRTRLAGAYRSLLGELRRRFAAAKLAEELSRLGAGSLSGPGEDVGAPAANLQVNWQHLLARHARPRARTPTLMRPDRRSLSHWGKRRERRARVVVAVDTSGSITPLLGATFLAELHRLRAHCASVTVIMADAAVQAVVRLEELAAGRLAGRGGTNFAPAIAYVNEHLADHDLMIYLTDGCAGLPPCRPAIPLVWVVTENRDFPGRPVVFTGAAPTGQSRPGARGALLTA